jgi:GntR family transcriptional regulator
MERYNASLLQASGGRSGNAGFPDHITKNPSRRGLFLMKAPTHRPFDGPHAAPVFDSSPKYLQIRTIILRWLATLKLGDKLPTEQALAGQFGVSRETIREALHVLEQDGIIARRPRVGTWLVRHVAEPEGKRITGPIEEFASMGITTRARLAKQGVIVPSGDVSQALKLGADEKIFEINRLRILDGSPLVLLQASFPVAIGRQIARMRLRTGLFVPALRSIHDPSVEEEYRQIDAAVATDEVAALLELPVGTPLLLVKRLFVDHERRPVVYFVSHFRSDRYFYTVNLPRARGARQQVRRSIAAAEAEADAR